MPGRDEARGGNALPHRPVERRVGVLLNLLTHATRSIATGFARYASERGNWSVIVAHGNSENFTPILGEGDFATLDGVATGYAWYRLPEGLQCPIVYVHTPDHPIQAPTVCADNEEIGKLAASYLTSLGLPYFVFVGVAPNAFSIERQRGFERALLNQSRNPERALLFENWAEMTHGANLLQQWLATLPLPCAVFCADDRMAAAVSTAAKQVGIHVPERLAILGVNDDDVACATVVPSLSSIGVNGEQIGYEAARQLDRSMSGESPTRSTVTRVPPGKVVPRGSTQVLGHDDPLVCEAMRLIQTRSPRESVVVDQIAAELRVHRHQLNRVFQGSLGHSPKEAIDRARATVLRGLLTDTSMPVKEIADRMGFGSVPQMIRFCRRTLGHTPSEVRSQSSQ